MKKKIITSILAFAQIMFCACDNGDIEPSSSDGASQVSDGKISIQVEPEITPDAEIEEMHAYAEIENAFPEIIFDGSDMRELKTDGLGVGLLISDEEVGLLQEYKQSDLERYEYILNLLFSQNTGVGFTHVIINQAANANLISDVRSINPDIIVSDGSDFYIKLSDYNDAPEHINAGLSCDLLKAIQNDESAENNHNIIVDSLSDLIDLNDPENGYVGIDSKLWQIANINLMIDNGWSPIGSSGAKAIEDDVICLAVTDPKTNNYTILLANNTPKTKKLTFTVRNFAAAANPLYVWETTGMSEGDADYYNNYFQNIDDFYPVEYGLDKYFNEMPEIGFDENESVIDPEAPYSFSFNFKPYSMTSFTTK
ncbi:MAG: hypothetical protein LBR74_09610, partial [Eubacterium sp.]|nr:hypothetical protein [Eubacterium sp.]